MADDSVLISVIIPVKNGAFWLEKTLRGITTQTLSKQTEIIVLDSGSTDDSLDISTRYKARIFHIDPASFNHGETRNIGVRQAKGKYVVLTVQDAWPTDEFWLQRLLDGFIHEEVCGVCGNQLVPHDKGVNPVAWSRPISEPQLREVWLENPNSFADLSPQLKKYFCGWDNVNAMYNKNFLLTHPFQPVLFGEDIQWAINTLVQGRTIVYNQAARVYHYHHYEPEFSYKRVYTECYYRYKLLGVIPEIDNGIINYLRDAKILIQEKSVSLWEKPGWLLYNIRLRMHENKALRQFVNDLRKGEIYLDMHFKEDFKIAPMAPKPTKSKYSHKLTL